LINNRNFCQKSKFWSKNQNLTLIWLPPLPNVVDLFRFYWVDILPFREVTSIPGSSISFLVKKVWKEFWVGFIFGGLGLVIAIKVSYLKFFIYF